MTDDTTGAATEGWGARWTVDLKVDGYVVCASKADGRTRRAP